MAPKGQLKPARKHAGVSIVRVAIVSECKKLCFMRNGEEFGFMGFGLTGIAAEKFEELTLGLSREDAAVSVFNYVRDIPYYIDLEHFDLQKGPCEMLLSDRGSCFPKHYLLGAMLDELEFEVAYHLYPFNWKDQELGMPEEVMYHAMKIPETCHIACKMFVEEKWIIVDATWSTAFSGLGFRVNDSWDGKKNLELAVIPSNELRAGDAEHAEKIVKDMFVSYTLGERLELSRFTIEFNKWMKRTEREGSIEEGK